MTATDRALSDFLEKELPGVYRLCIRLASNQESAEKLCRDVFSLALKKYPTLLDVPSTNTWLFRLLISEWKRRRVKTEVQALDPVQKLINTLTPDEKTVLLLRDVESKNIGETALILDISVNTARSRLSRARESFRMAVRRSEGKRG